MIHKLPASFLTQRIHIDLVGAGGNGSQMLTGLARLHVAMRALGHPHGLPAAPSAIRMTDTAA